MQRAQATSNETTIIPSWNLKYHSLKKYDNIKIWHYLHPLTPTIINLYPRYGGVNFLINDVLNVHENVDLILEVVSLFLKKMMPFAVIKEKKQ